MTKNPDFENVLGSEGLSRASLESVSMLEVLDSRIVKIIAGPEKQICHVHSGALSASNSKSLQALVSEKWNADGDKDIDWSHTDSETVRRLITHLYTGGYFLPEPRYLSSTILSVGKTDVESDVTISKDDTKSKGKEKSTEEPGLETVSNTSTNGEENPQAGEVSVGVYVPPIQRSSDIKAKPRWSYQKLMFALVHLNCFAAYHCYEKLEKSTRLHLEDIMKLIDWSQSHAISELTEVARYVYEHTLSPPNSRPNLMRSMLSDFIVTNFSDLCQDELVSLFIEGGDEFALDVAQKLRKRMGTLQRRNEHDRSQLGDAEYTIGNCNRCSRKWFHLKRDWFEEDEPIEGEEPGSKWTGPPAGL